MYSFNICCNIAIYSVFRVMATSNVTTSNKHIDTFIEFALIPTQQ